MTKEEYAELMSLLAKLEFEVFLMLNPMYSISKNYEKTLRKLLEHSKAIRGAEIPLKMEND